MLYNSQEQLKCLIKGNSENYVNSNRSDVLLNLRQIQI